MDILGRSVAIHNGTGPIIACAPIVVAETLTAAEYSNKLLVIKQDSTFEDSTLVLSDEYPDNNPGVEVYEDAIMTNKLCPAEAAPYNPYNVGTDGGV